MRTDPAGDPADGSAGLSEDQARDLLHQAARTIDIGTAALTFPTPARRWPAVVAAAAAVVLLAGVVAVIDTRDHPTSTQVAGGGTPVLVPSVFGLTRDQARARLEGAGLRVSTISVATCEVDGLALFTTPAAGDPAPSGRVALTWNDTRSIDCPQPEALQWRADAFAVLGFLAGSGPALVFADRVELQVDDGPPLTLDAAQAADPSGWYAGAQLRTTIGQRLDVPGASLAAEVERGGRAAARCGTPRAAGTANTDALSLVLTDPRVDETPGTVVNGREQPSRSSCQTTVDLWRNAAGAINAIVVGTKPQGFVSAPATLTDDRVEADINAAATQLIKFATQDQGPLSLTDRVGVYVNGEPRGLVPGSDLTDRDAWSGCIGSAGCGQSVLMPLVALRAADDDVEVEPTPDPLNCLSAEDAALPDAIASLRHAVVQPATVRTCDRDFRLTLYVDGQGRIAAVDLVHALS